MTADQMIQDSKERAEVRRCMEALQREPSHVRSAAGNLFLAAMRTRPDLVAEFARNLLDGTYGAGWKEAGRAAKRGLTPLKDLCVLVAAVEWQCPAREASAAYGKLYIEDLNRLRKAMP